MSILDKVRGRKKSEAAPMPDSGREAWLKAVESYFHKHPSLAARRIKMLALGKPLQIDAHVPPEYGQELAKKLGVRIG